MKLCVVSCVVVCFVRVFRSYPVKSVFVCFRDSLCDVVGHLLFACVSYVQCVRVCVFV